MESPNSSDVELTDEECRRAILELNRRIIETPSSGIRLIHDLRCIRTVEPTGVSPTLGERPTGGIPARSVYSGRGATHTLYDLFYWDHVLWARFYRPDRPRAIRVEYICADLRLTLLAATAEFQTYIDSIIKIEHLDQPWRILRSALGLQHRSPMTVNPPPEPSGITPYEHYGIW